MNRLLILGTLAGAAAAIAVGCGTAEKSNLESSSDPTATTDDTAAGSLPCDVKAVIKNNGCLDCHGTKPTTKKTSSLVTYEDLTKVDEFDDSGKTVAEVSLARMKSKKDPMPPSPADLASAADIATLQKWITGGYKSSVCKTTASKKDSGTSIGTDDTGTPVDEDGGSASATDSGVTDPFNTPSVCTSGTKWTKGNGSSMRPGAACASSNCHSGDFSAAGTIYPTGHEPDFCNGSPAGASIIITDKNGATYTLKANSVGNFYTSKSIPTPYTAVISYNGKTRAMKAPQTSGDCNSCHTETGTKAAPGRIMLP